MKIRNQKSVKILIPDFSVCPLVGNPHSEIRNRGVKSSFKILPVERKNRRNREIARAGWSWGWLRRPGSHQGRQEVGRRSSVPSVTESKRRHRRRRNTAVLRVLWARIATRRQDPGNHARGPRWRTRSWAPASSGWSCPSIPAWALGPAGSMRGARGRAGLGRRPRILLD